MKWKNIEGLQAQKLKKTLTRNDETWYSSSLCMLFEFTVYSIWVHIVSDSSSLCKLFEFTVYALYF